MTQAYKTHYQVYGDKSVGHILSGKAVARPFEGIIIIITGLKITIIINNLDLRARLVYMALLSLLMSKVFVIKISIERKENTKDNE